MSGFICPECSSTYLKPKGTELQCELCGWVGEDDGSRKWLTEEGDDDNARRYAQVKAGKLFIIRVKYVGTPSARSDDISETMHILEITGMGGSENDKETNYSAELSSRPSEELITKIKKLKTVKTVRVFP